MDPSQGLPGNEFRESFEARPRDPPDAVPLQQIQNRGNGKNLYRAPPFAEFKLAPAPGADNPENRVDTWTFVGSQTHLMLRSKGPLTRPRDSKLNRNLSSSGRNRRWGSSTCSDVLPVSKNRWGKSVQHQRDQRLSRLGPRHFVRWSKFLDYCYADLGTFSEITAILSDTLTGLSLTEAGKLLLQQSATIRQAPNRRQTFRYFPRSVALPLFSEKTTTE